MIYAPAAFAALAEHPSAVHVRLWAPLEWRISAYKREQLVDRRCAEKALKRDDHGKRAWVKSLYHVDIDDLRLFSSSSTRAASHPAGWSKPCSPPAVSKPRPSRPS